MRRPALLAVPVLAGAALALTGCTAPPPAAHVVVTVAPSAAPAGYDVHVAAAEGGYRAAGHLRPGQTQRFAVPAGWLTVRVPGLCVVPTAASGTTHVTVGRDACRLG